LRSVQAQTGALISGDFARPFFAGTTESINKLLIDVGGGSNLLRLKTFLESNDWTPTDARATRNQDAASQYSSCDAVYRKGSDDQDALWIYFKKTGPRYLGPCMWPWEQFDACDRFHPAIDWVLDQDSTAHLNIISSEQAYSLFPRLTILENGVYVVQDGLDQAFAYRHVS
jgi:hypothetical protein